MYDATMAETVTIAGDGGDAVEAYLARRLDRGPRGGVVVIHHMPGYDAATKEITRRLAVQGFNALCPNLYHREAPGASPDDAAAAARAAGGVSDDRLVGDVGGAAEALRRLAGSNGKVGVIGYCSGGRQAFLAACRLRLDAVVDCYGGFVVEAAPPDSPVPRQPVVTRAAELSCPLLGLFGADDQHPGPAETKELGRVLDELGKVNELHTYEGAGHAFFAVDRPSYRPDAAADGWRRIEAWFERHLAG
ncbi:MAG TPA: dienelactone hydrolase family protein [Candidatus Micrarchaeia archaeon]|nr:dienelactone hydrolase family protein [Candidatus Micrarchaeia archaeon]